VIFVTLGDLCGEEEVRWYKSYKPPQKGESNNVTTYQGFNADLTLHLTFFFQFMLDELRRQIIIQVINSIHGMGVMPQKKERSASLLEVK